MQEHSYLLHLVVAAVFGNLIRLGYGCPNQCFIDKKHTSQPESEIIAWILQHYPNLEIHQSVRSLIKSPYTNQPLELDIYIPELRLAFEFNGIYWHSDEMIKLTRKGFTSAKQYHDYKTEACAKQGIRLVHIDEREWREGCGTAILTKALQESNDNSSGGGRFGR